MPNLHSHVVALAPASADAAFAMPSFRRQYRVIRKALAATIFAVTLATGFSWSVEAANVVLPTVLGLAATILVHDRLLPRVSWRSMAVFDSVAYTGILVIIELPEPIGFVVMSHVLICFLTIPPRRAVVTTGFLLGVGWAGYIATAALETQVYLAGERLFLSVLASIMAMVPSCWAMLLAGSEMRAQRAKAEQLLTEKDRLLADRDRFLAGVSHELRTPLTVVHGLATLLESADLEDAERRELIRAVAQESGDVAAIVEDLLALTRVEGGQLSVRPQRTELRPLLRQVSRSTGLDQAAVTDLDATVMADPVRVRQVVRNLVSNAQRYGGPDIRIEISADACEVTLAICDDGQGVPTEKEQLIFEPYGRAHDQPAHVDSVGLGLSVSRELARLMGGDVTYQRADDWTRFELILPIQATVAVE